MEAVQKYRSPEYEQNVYMKTIVWVIRKTLSATLSVIRIGARIAFAIIKNQLSGSRRVPQHNLPKDPHLTGDI